MYFLVKSVELFDRWLKVCVFVVKGEKCVKKKIEIDVYIKLKSFFYINIDKG